MSSETRLREAVQESLKHLREQYAAALDAVVSTFIEAAVAERDAEVAEARAETEAAVQQTLEESLAKAKAEADAQLAEARAEIAADAQQKIERAMAEADSNLADALKAARDDARAEADVAVAAALGTAREDAAKARADADKARQETAQARADADQARGETAQARAEAGRARDEIVRAHADADTAREEAANARAEADLDLANAISNAHSTEAETDLAGSSRLLDAIKALDDARSLTEVFDVLAEQAACEADRAAVLLVRGEQICGWRFVGFGDAVPDARSIKLSLDGAGVIVDAVCSGMAKIAGPEIGGFGFAPLPTGRAGLAVPMEVGGRIVAVVYADDAAPEARTAGIPRAWPEAVEILARHAARCLEALTVMHSTRERQTVSAGSASEPTVVGQAS
jgi:chemotaxis protein histidine kinase CheA